MTRVLPRPQAGVPHRLAPLVAPLAAAALALAAADHAWGQPGQQFLAPSLAAATFDSAWTVIHRTHFDTTFNGVDWPALRDELRPRAVAARTQDELRAVIREMLGRLRQSHFELIPAEDAAGNEAPDGAVGVAAGDVGLELRLVGDDVVVFRVDEGSPAAEAGIRPGWAVRAVSDLDAASVVREARERTRTRPPGFYSAEFAVVRRLSGRLLGEPGTTCRVVFEDGNGRTVERELRRRPWPGQPITLGNLPTFLGRVEAAEVNDDAGLRVGVIRFNVWMAPLAREIDEAVDRFRDADGIILDLRGNPGGLGAMVGGVAGHFLDEPALLGVQHSRGAELRYQANPRRVNSRGERVRPFAGPLAVLVDGLSASATEVFAGGLRAIGRARVFGQTTAGGVLPASTYTLPNGDVLMHAIGDFVTANGERLEGRGVVPDEPVALTRADLLAGRDAALLAALRWIGAERAGDR